MLETVPIIPRTTGPVETVLCDDPDHNPMEGNVEFHLTYEGRLLGASEAKHKHAIRKVFHRQVRRLWDTHPYLITAKFGKWDGAEHVPADTLMRDGLAMLYPMGNYHFVPLVTQRLFLTCSLDILFLRSDPPGSVLQSGDIDNRLKTLFDALRKPTNTAELGGHLVPEECENPFFCLLEDDKLISHVSVVTDQLFEPTGSTFDTNDARLVIKVGIRPYYLMWGNVGFG
jgi:hypothetical protein